MEKINLGEKSINTKKLVYISLLVSISIVLHTLEAMLPLPSPWIKLGITNIGTLLALVLLGFQEAMIVAFLRALIGSILFGTFLSPTFMLSLAGGMSSAIVMGLFYKFSLGYFSLVSVSFLGAYTHTTVVMLLVYFFIIHHNELLYLFPIFLLFSAATGIMNGLLANVFLRKLTEEKSLDIKIKPNEIAKTI